MEFWWTYLITIQSKSSQNKSRKKAIKHESKPNRTLVEVFSNYFLVLSFLVLQFFYFSYTWSSVGIRTTSRGQLIRECWLCMRVVCASCLSLNFNGHAKQYLITQRPLTPHPHAPSPFLSLSSNISFLTQLRILSASVAHQQPTHTHTHTHTSHICTSTTSISAFFHLLFLCFFFNFICFTDLKTNRDWSCLSSLYKKKLFSI